MTHTQTAYIAMIILLLVGAVAFTGCTESDRQVLATPDPSTVSSANTCEPTDFTAGVLYYPCTYARFANSIAKWKHDHPDRIITSFAGDDTGPEGRTQGYTVNTEPRA